MSQKHCVIVGAGLTGASAAWHLVTQSGGSWRVSVYEKEHEPGGQLRSCLIGGIRAEPHGPHIFHTSNDQAARLVTPYLNGYRHKVKTRVSCSSHGDHILTWPLQVGELKLLPEWPKIESELASLPSSPHGGTFESYAVSLMGPTLYEWTCYSYTAKQWGTDPVKLSSSFAPKRIDLRTDGNPEMFRDPWQGWCDDGWQVVVESLLRGARADCFYKKIITHRNMPDADAYVITSALDDFLDTASPLPWRGIETRFTHVLDEDRPLPAAVVNQPSADVPYTRIVEPALMASPHLRASGSLTGYEYPGAPVRHYPVDDFLGVNRARHRKLAAQVKAELPTAQLAGRLATYAYIDMDAAILQGAHAASRVMREGTGE